MENTITPLIAAEAIAVLENTEDSLLKKIPSKLIEVLQEKADELGRKVNLDYSKSYHEQNISEERCRWGGDRWAPPPQRWSGGSCS